MADSLDDHEGERTRDAITNFHGIVKFEINKIFTENEDLPTTGWQNITPIAESTSFAKKLANGNCPLILLLK